MSLNKTQRDIDSEVTRVSKRQNKLGSLLKILYYQTESETTVLSMPTRGPPIFWFLWIQHCTDKLRCIEVLSLGVHNGLENAI
jgi:hypothetical protein